MAAPRPTASADRRRSGLELVRQLAPGRLLVRDLADHVAAHQEGLHPLEQLRASPQEADPARAAHLVAGDGHEVGAERLDVDAAVRRCLRGVAHVDRALLVCPGGERGDVADRPQRVRDEVRRDDLHAAAGGDLVQRIQPDLAVVVQGKHAEVRAHPLGHVLPGDVVRVVLELGDDHEIAGTEVVQAPGVGDEVDRLGRVAEEDDLAGRGRVHECARLLAGALVRRRRALAERVDAAVDVRVRGLVEAVHRLQHLARLLGGDRGVQVRERLAVEVLLEDGEVGPQLVRVDSRLRGRYRHGTIVLGRVAATGRPAGRLRELR